MSSGRNQVHPLTSSGSDQATNQPRNSISGYSRFRDIVLESEARVDPANLLEVPDYKRIQVVGSGSFGVAVLYQKVGSQQNGALVVLKQINLTGLSSLERELALNEVEIFSKLHHPNVIKYFDSFIRSDTLLIEMEYADGGTLAQRIHDRQPNNRFTERYILNILEQITSAVNYMHNESILHRDLKTANIFMTQREVVKIGDFGISKIVNTKIRAQTVLGTPFYFSPEMCQGLEYDEKSDIWALGCVLGEMCCLKKAFAAQNLSELVSKIMAAQYNAVPTGYSDGLRYLLKLLLQKEPHDRPAASEVLKYWIPFIYRSLGKQNGHQYVNGLHSPLFQDVPSTSTFEAATNNLNYTNQSTATLDATPFERTVLYQLKSFLGSVSVRPLQLPPTIRVSCLASSGNHFIAVTTDGAVYTWGEGNKGQLGHNSVDSWLHFPTRLEFLGKYHINGACAGDGFSIFWTDLGVVFTVGDNSHGALGHGNQKSLLIPKRIEKLDNNKIIQVAAGSTHVVALNSEGEVFVWGESSTGALGFGQQTTMITFPNRLLSAQMMSGIKEIRCGPDCTVILNNQGEVYCSGNNNFNKLGVGPIEKVVAFRKILVFDNKKVIDFSVSASHSAFVLEGGFVVTMGSNAEGQRAIETKQLKEPNLVKQIKNRYITMVRCHPTYTVAFTDDNCVLFWGTRFGIPENDDSKEAPQQVEDWGNNTTAFTNFLTSVYRSETIYDPVDVLALYSSKEQLAKGHYLKLLSMVPLTQSILILVETTTPLADNV